MSNATIDAKSIQIHTSTADCDSDSDPSRQVVFDESSSILKSCSSPLAKEVGEEEVDGDGDNDDDDDAVSDEGAMFSDSDDDEEGDKEENSEKGEDEDVDNSGLGVWRDKDMTDAEAIFLAAKGRSARMTSIGSISGNDADTRATLDEQIRDMDLNIQAMDAEGRNTIAGAESNDEEDFDAATALDVDAIFKKSNSGNDLIESVLVSATDDDRIQQH